MDIYVPYTVELALGVDAKEFDESDLIVLGVDQFHTNEYGQISARWPQIFWDLEEEIGWSDDAIPVLQEAVKKLPLYPAWRVWRRVRGANRRQACKTARETIAAEIRRNDTRNCACGYRFVVSNEQALLQERSDMQNTTCMYCPWWSRDDGVPGCGGAANGFNITPKGAPKPKSWA